MDYDKLDWLDYLSIGILAVGFVVVFIPICGYTPQGTEEVTFYSILTYSIELMNTTENGALYLFSFIVFLFFSGLAILLAFFQKRLFYRVLIAAAGLMIMFFARRGWPVNTLASIIALTYFSLFLISMLVDSIRNRILRKKQRSNF